MFETYRAAQTAMSYASSGISQASRLASEAGRYAQETYESFESSRGSNQPPPRPARRGQQPQRRDYHERDRYDDRDRGSDRGRYDDRDRYGDRDRDRYDDRDRDRKLYDGPDDRGRYDDRGPSRYQGGRRDQQSSAGYGGSSSQRYRNEYGHDYEDEPRGYGRGSRSSGQRGSPPRSSSADRDYRQSRPSAYQNESGGPSRRYDRPYDDRYPEDQRDDSWRKQASISKWSQSAGEQAEPPVDDHPSSQQEKKGAEFYASQATSFIKDKVTGIVAKARGDVDPDFPDVDGDTELSRLMKKYYTGKARTRQDLPNWLFGDVSTANIDINLPSSSSAFTSNRRGSSFSPSASNSAILTAPPAGSAGFDIFSGIRASSSTPSLSPSRPSSLPRTGNTAGGSTAAPSMSSSGPPPSAAALRLKAMREAQKAGKS